VNGWLNDTNECNWYRISCQTMDLGDDIGMQNVVTNIDFYDDIYFNGNNYTGTIPADLGLLTALQFLNLGVNSLTGTSPESIGQWTLLTYFDVESNALTGTLPESIGQWTLLTFFVANNNSLTGTVPASISSWRQILGAYFRSNELTGTMPFGICNNIDQAAGDQLWADCWNEINCTCCNQCF
jgi:hypothetical protein